MNLKIKRVLYFFGMISVDTVATVKFWKEGEHGALRIGDTRVSLDSVYYRYMDGASPEEIAEMFPAISLAEVYGTIGHILANREAMDEYIRQGEIHAEKVQAMIEEKYGDRMQEFKERLRERYAELQKAR